MDQRMDDNLFTELWNEAKKADVVQDAALIGAVIEANRAREAEIVLSDKCTARNVQIEKLLNSNSDLLDVIIKKGKEYEQIHNEFKEIQRQNANLEKIVQSWKDACSVERKLVQSKANTIKKLRSEIEECKRSAYYGR